ncbi:MAG TPA: hypothetical protein VHD63_17710, partial [Ktedonobacteraceae bacterium]|nr:hypothetical protein [Ktedonobacteraceae bacterium]
LVESPSFIACEKDPEAVGRNETSGQKVDLTGSLRNQATGTSFGLPTEAILEREWRMKVVPRRSGNISEIAVFVLPN